MRNWSALIIAAWLGGGSFSLEAQTRTVSGRVTDAQTGAPVPVGTVSIQGASLRDHLRPDGVFVLHAPSQDITLVIQSEGYQRRTIAVTASQEVVFIRLVPDVVELEGIVTQSAVGSANRATSTATVRARDIEQVPAASVKQALQGKVAGADIQYNSGVPGGDLQLTLRGATTLLGAVSPVYVVDGVLISTTSIASGAAAVTGGQRSIPDRVADLNPNDIESIKILKGAAASAMYGSKGSNGVIIITTKRGSGDRSRGTN